MRSILSRRGFLYGLGAFALSGISLSGYAFGIEPSWMRIKHDRIAPTGWPDGLNLRIAAIADIHAGDPWMSVTRIERIVETANALNADLIVLLGDYAAGHYFVTNPVHSRDWSKALGALSAPLGVHAILGNHDWWDDYSAQRRGSGPVYGRLALEKVGIPVYENDAVRLDKAGKPFWLAGLGDQHALLSGKRWRRRQRQGVDDLAGTLRQISDDAPVVLLAHEPDIFPEVPDSVSLTLCGHTHGGQVRLAGYSPIVPSRYGSRYAYGHIVEKATAASASPRHMIVSGGLGCSILPVRFGSPPEINLIEVGAGPGSAET